MKFGTIILNGDPAAILQGADGKARTLASVCAAAGLATAAAKARPMAVAQVRCM